MANLTITAFTEPLNRALRRRPYLLLLDLGFVTALIALSGGLQSPLYALRAQSNHHRSVLFFFVAHSGRKCILAIYLLAIVTDTQLTQSTVPLLELLPFLLLALFDRWCIRLCVFVDPTVQQNAAGLIDAQETIAQQNGD